MSTPTVEETPTPPTPRKKPYHRIGTTVTIIGIDPGETTGIAVVTIDARWVRGLGVPSYDGMRAAIKSRTAYQIGRNPKAMFSGDDKPRPLTVEQINERMLPIYADQPLHEDNGMRSDTRFAAIMAGEGINPAGGAPLQFNDAEEVIQVRQIAGLLENYSHACIVIEDFTLRTGVRGREVTSPDRLRLAITTNEILHGSGRTPFLQQPAYAKTTALDDRVKRAGLWFPGMQHANDAARHVLTFLRDARQWEQIRAHAWPTKFSDQFGDD